MLKTLPQRFLALSSLALFAFTLTACSESPNNAESEEGPLSKYMSALWDGEEFTQEKFDEQQARTQELISKCMAKEGFEYKPTQNSGGVLIGGSDDEIDWGSLEFAKQYGYGVVESPGMSQADSAEEEWEDPNDDYVASLSESEQSAFYKTLHGEPQEEVEMNDDLLLEGDSASSEVNVDGYEYNWKTAGCYGAAENEMSADDSSVAAAYEDPEFAELFTGVEGVWRALQEPGNEKFDALNRKWSTCLAEAGEGDYARANEPREELGEEYQNMWIASNREESDEPTKEEKTSFQEREIRIAVADWQCRKETKYEDGMQKALFASEQKFVDENRVELDAMLAKHGVKKKK